MSDAWWVYVVRCGDDTLYTGIATDVERRVDEHARGTGARYTRARRPIELVFREAHPDRSSAARREAEIKKLDRNGKLALIESDSG